MGALYATVQNTRERTVHVKVAGIHMASMLRRLLEREFRMHLISQCCANPRGVVVMRLVALVEATLETVSANRAGIHTIVTGKQLVNIKFECAHMQSVELTQYVGTSDHRCQRLQQPWKSI